MSISTAALDIMFATCGVLSNIRLKSEKYHAFITFMDYVAAARFVEETFKDLYIKKHKSKVG
ncbi:MAG: hypothetical protein BYD32DRAFT_464247 [Podila humilis]|nr:MAG: hypothetical protein BYD32DRAFT_464247 [Podila humilis]